MAQYVIKQLMNIPYLKTSRNCGFSHTSVCVWDTNLAICGPATASAWASKKGQIQVLLSSRSISLLVFLAVVPSEMSPLWRPPSILCINVNNELYNHNMAEDSLHKGFVTFFQCCDFTLKNSGMSWMFPQSSVSPLCYLTNRLSCVSFLCLFLQH